MAAVSRSVAPLLAALALTAACADARRVDPGLPECERCHGGNGSSAPAASPLGHRTTADRSVGAHRRHLEAHPGAVRTPIACEECHRVPDRVEAPGHIDGPHATVTFGPLARGGLAAPAWDREALTCTATYCHGATLDAGGTNTAPVWTRVDEGQAACGTCHGNPPPLPHPANPACERCHPATVLAGGAIDLVGGQHIDGGLDVGALGCTSCHGSAANAAPPVATTGESDPSAIAVGAHQPHLRTGTIRLALPCESCHLVPTASLHADGTVDLAWSTLAGSVVWDRGAKTCSTYCHGATLAADGTNTLPVWTEVGTGQTACGTCHGNPPLAPHPASADCERCHPDTISAGAIDVAGGQHIDGGLDVGPLGCTTCHGSAANAAPPLSTAGGSATSEIAVGAHQAHLADGPIRRAVGCASCHALPAANLHADGTVDLAWSTLAGAVVWDRGARTCSTYCHGATLAAGGTNTLPVWTGVGTGQTACGTCHGFPPPPPHPASTACAGCHPETVTALGAIDVAGGQHIDGDLDGSTTCGSCHGVPPASGPASGAHLAHAPFADPSAVAYGDQRILEDYAPAGGPAYLFGCGHCHPLDPALHMDATVQVDLSPAAPATGLRARNAAAAAYAGGTCSGVYCHSSGQATPAYAATPAWTAAPGTLGCGGCHGNPPRYPSGGPGAPDANSHVNLDVYDPWGWEFGHFAGMPGAYHTSKHGGYAANGFAAGNKASPITCQTCHYDTVDPAKVRGSGFFYFDPDGGYDLRPEGDPLRGTNTSWLAMQCSTCHSAEAGSGGRALPLRHVNGRRDVAFDPRTALPDGYPAGLPALATSDPVRPYYMTKAGSRVYALTAADCVAAPQPSCGVAADVVVRQSAVGATPPSVLTFKLEHAAWDPATKTCSAVACHLERQRQVEAGTKAPLQWGAPYTWDTACSSCHEI